MRLTRLAMNRCAAILLVMLGGCESAQLSYNTLDVASTIGPIYLQEVLGNFAKLLEDPAAIPSQATLQAGVIQVTNSLTPSITFPLTSMFANAVGTTATKTTTTAGSSMTLGASVAWQQNYTVQPVSDPFTLRNLGIMYQSVLVGNQDILNQYYQPPRIYDRHDQLVPDPYYLEHPQCVLCLLDPRKPPQTDSRAELLQKTEPNDLFKSHWLRWTGVGSPTLGPDFVPVGSAGGYSFYVQQGKINYFREFVYLTLPLTAAPSRFTSISSPVGGGKGPKSAGALAPAEPRLAPGPAEGVQRPSTVIIPQILQVPQ